MMRSTFVTVALAVLFSAAPARTQSRRRTPVPTLPPPAHEAPTLRPPRAEESASLAKRVGVGRAEVLLRSEVASDRERGLERLGAEPTTRALEALARALEPGGAAQTARERLTAVRGLAASAGEAEVRLALLRVMSGASGQGAGESADPLEKAVRDAAALALSRSGSPEAFAALGKALRQEGAMGEAAALAVEAHPPTDVAPLLAARGTPTPALARALGAIGDQRAFHALRDYVKRGSVALRAESALALTRLGALETVALGRHWFAHETDPVLRVAGATILASTRDPGAGAALRTLLEDPELSGAALDLALSAPNPELVPVLRGRLAGAEPEQLPRLLAAISRAGGSAAAAALSAELARPDHAAFAAHALAACPGDEARVALERALGVAATRRLAARAAVLREVMLDESVSGIGSVLQSLLVSPEAADRAAGAWGLAVLDPRRGAELIGSADQAVVRAAARAALPGSHIAQVAADRLRRERDATTRAALAIALADPAARARVPTAVLLELIEQGGVEAPLAALSLASRDEPDLRSQVIALLTSSDAVLRAHTALGLGASPEPDAVGLLENAYRFEPDALVRHAVVTALSQRTEPVRRRTLGLAAALDGDRRVREAAKLAGRGVRLGAASTADGALWLILAATAASGTGAGAWSALASLPGGIALPLVADPDGLVAVARLPRGAVSVRIGRAGR